MKKINFLLVFIFLVAASVNAQVAQPTLVNKVEPSSNPLIIPYEKWKLPNGLTVILHEDHSDPIVQVRVTYHVGSARESIGKSGFAHFYEHMMFEGSEHVKDKEHFKIVSEVGGELNGFTERDFTTYFEILPSNALETALWLESDRMGFLLDSLSDKKFENQRSTVKNEKGEDIEKFQYFMAFEELINQILYPKGHPYSWPTIGYVDDLDRASVKDLKDFFLRWYGPNNAVVTLAGDINSKDALAMVQKYFGSINPCPEVKKLKAPVPVLAIDQYANYTDNTYLPMTLMVYPTVPMFHRDEAALDLLADMIGDGNNSIFYKNFVKTEKAAQASVGHSTSELSGEFQIVIMTYPGFDPSQIGKGFNETEKLIHSTIDEFEKTGITDEALQRAKAKMEAHKVDELNTVFGKASMLVLWDMLIGKPYNLSDDIARYNNVTKDDIIRVYGKYIKDKKAAFVNAYPADPMAKDTVKSVNPNAGMPITENPEYAGLKYVKAKDTFDRSKRPALAAPKTPEIPAYFTSQLKNGIKVIGTQSTEAANMVILLEIEGGSLVFASDPKKNDVPSMTAAMMEEGSLNFTTEQISAELQKLGSTISFRANKQNTVVEMTCLAKNLDATLKLLEEKLLRPRFAADDFKRVKKQKYEEQMNNKSIGQISAGKEFTSLVYGNTIMGAYSSAKGIDKVSLDDVKNYYQQYYSPTVTQLIFVGNMKESELMPKLQFLENWKGKEVKIPEITGFPAVEQTQIYLVHKEHASQSVILMGHMGMPFDYNGDHFRAEVMNFELGGSFNGRLNSNLREDKGYTYGIYSYFSGTKIPGAFQVFASVRTNATDSALTEITKEIKSYVKQGINDDEVTYTKNSLLNSEALKYEAPIQKAEFLYDIARYNLPKDYTTQQSQILKGMSKADIDKAAQQFIHPEKMVIVVSGNKWLIKKPLENLGYKVKEVTVD